MEQHKIELLPNAKSIRAKQARWNPRYTAMVKEELDKLLEAGFIRPVKTTEWVSCYGPTTNKWRITRQDKFY